MAVLTVPDQPLALTETDTIRDYLAARGIWHDRWEASRAFPPDATQEEVLEAYSHALQPYMAEHGYQTADVVCVHPETPGLAEVRDRFLREHTHTEDEVRFFVEGQGFFWFNLGGEEPVFYVHCRAGDLLSVPAGVRHWFDLGPSPLVKAIRIFTDASGWTPHYTDSGIETRYRAESEAC